MKSLNELMEEYPSGSDFNSKFCDDHSASVTIENFCNLNYPSVKNHSMIIYKTKLIGG